MIFSCQASNDFEFNLDHIFKVTLISMSYFK